MNMQSQMTPIKNKPFQQPAKYSQEELNKLRSFINIVKNDEKRSQLVCWGNNFNKGY